MNNRSLTHRVLAGLFRAPAEPHVRKLPARNLSLTRRVLAGLFGVTVQTEYSPPESRSVPVRSPVLVSVGARGKYEEELDHSRSPELEVTHPGIRRPWGYLASIVIADITGMAVPLGLALRALDQPYAVLIGAFLGVLWLLVRSARRRYYLQILGENHQVGRIVVDWLIFIALLILVFVLLRIDIAPSLAVAAATPGLSCTYSAEFALHKKILRDRRQARAVHRVLVVGETAAVEHAVNRLAGTTDHPYGIVGVVPVGEEIPAFRARTMGRLPKREASAFNADTRTIILSAADIEADLILLVQGNDLMGRRLRRIIWGLQDAGFPLATLTPPEDVAAHRLLMRHAAGLTVFHVLPSAGPFRETAKELIDKFGALLLLLIFAPLMLVIGIAIRLSGRGPIFHRQTRVGKGARPFTMYKFRTMVPNFNKAQLANIDINTAGLMFKVRKDPRITRVGSLLRRLSLDELPQLLNVLRGDMSLVGPRPPLPDEVTRYDEMELRRLKVMPGITGVWQVSGRSDLTWDECVSLDLYYVDNWSIAFDFKILARTLPAVIDGRGAY